MKASALFAAGAAVIGIAGCTHGAAAHSTSPASQGTRTPITPVSCTDQYRTWIHGEGKGVMDALGAITSAATAGHAHMPTAALKQARTAVTTGAKHPIPACADPRGYWSVLLMHVNAAVSGRGPASSAQAAIRDVPEIHHQLLVEVKQLAQ